LKAWDVFTFLTKFLWSLFLIKREYKISNLDLFAGFVTYIKEVLEKEKTPEENLVEEKYVVYFPDCMGQHINKLA
jgi:hypothetical protein